MVLRTVLPSLPPPLKLLLDCTTNPDSPVLSRSQNILHHPRVQFRRDGDGDLVSPISISRTVRTITRTGHFLTILQVDLTGSYLVQMPDRKRHPRSRRNI